MIGTSLIARAASSTSRGSGSLRNRAIAGSSARRKASKTPIRAAGESSCMAFAQAPDLAGSDQPHDPGVAQVGIAVSVGAQHLEQRFDRLGPAELAQGDRREESNPRAGVLEQTDQPIEGLAAP